MPIPTCDHVPLGRRAERSCLASTCCIGHRAPNACVQPESRGVAGADSAAARESASGTSESADIPRDRSHSPPRRRATAVAAGSIGTPCCPCCWSRGRGARRRGAAGWCARWGSARLALARTRRWAAAAQITPLSIIVRAAAPYLCMPPLPPPCTWRRPAVPAPSFHRLPPSPTLRTSATPRCPPIASYLSHP